VAPDEWHRVASPQNHFIPKAVRYDPAYRLLLNDKMSHPPLNAKCPFPSVLAKIIEFTNKTNKTHYFLFYCEKYHTDLHASTKVRATVNPRPTANLLKLLKLQITFHSHALPANSA